MKKILISFVTTVAWVQLLYSQTWQSYNPTLGFGDFNTVDILKPGYIVTGGGQQSGDSIQVMFTSADYGITWNENQHDGLESWNKSIAFSDTLNGLGVGYQGRIIKTNDGGANWGWAVYPINRNFNKIVNVSPAVYYAVGGRESNDSMRTIIRTSDSGTTWQVIYDTAGTWLKSVFFINPLKGFVVGDSGVILATTNGGNTWSSIPAPIQRNFNAITFINADTGFIAGGDQHGPDHRTILRTNDGGATWTILLDTIGGILNDVSFADSLVGYLAGDSAAFLKTSDGGQTWAPQLISNTLTGLETFRAVKFYDRNFGVIGGKGGLLWVYTHAAATEAYTMGSGLVDTTQATVNAVINTHGYPVWYSFYYSADSNLATLSVTYRQYFNSNSLTPVNSQIYGLLPNTRYYYCVAAQTVSGMVYGDTLSFFTGITSFAFQTDTATNITYTTAMLHGTINKLPVPASIFFDYDTTPAFNHFIVGAPSFVSDTLQHVINAAVSSLLPGRTYYYRLRGVTGSNVSYYGDIYIFNTPPPFATFQTLAASNITDTSATLNGLVWRPDYTTTLSFEYGTSPAFGSVAAAVPASVLVSDTQQHAITAAVNSLLPATTYYYRLKGVTDSGASFYGNTYIFNTPFPFAIFQALAPTHITDTSATFNGLVWRPDYTTTLSFEYDTSLAFGNELAATPASVSVNDTLQHVITATINSLHRNTTYYYRLKGVTDSGVSYYSNIYTFNTPTPFAIFQTLAPANVTDTSATLNGLVWWPYYTTTLSFEYDTSLAFGNEVATIPSSVNDTLYHWLNVPVTGLQTGVTYYYRLKGITDSGTYYGGTRYFYTGVSNAVAKTLPATVTSDTTVIFNGTIQGFIQPVTVSFEYGTTPAMTQQSDNYHYSDTTLWYVGGSGSGLLPNTLYYFRLRGETSIGTTYGSTLTFYTGNSNRGFQTLLATAVSPTSAQLNGQADALLLPTDLSFEYGTTRAFGNVIVGTPNNVHDILQHRVSAALTGLVPNTLYYYRLKGSVSPGINFYGNTEQLYTADCEIPNCDFEIWDTATAESPTGWSAVGMSVHRVPSYNGTNAAQIIGGLLLGSVHNGLQFSGGCSFPARPDSIMFYARYNIAAGDTAFVITSFSLNGIAISQQWFPITGSSGGNYILKKYKITFPTNAVPDSLALVFVSSNPHSANSLNPNSVLTIDDISFAGTNLTVPNGNFELWQTFVRENPQAWTANFGDFRATLVFEPVVKTTDHVSGNYALLMHTNPSISYKPASIVTGQQLIFNQPAFAVGARHNTLNGYMKYQPQNGDTLSITLNMFSHGVDIGNIYETIDTEIIQYTPFSFNIFYLNQYAADIPDSAFLSIAIGGNNAHGNSVAYIDNLSFDGFRVIGINEQNNHHALCTLYPNPANNNLTVELNGFTGKVLYKVYDMCGRNLLNSSENVERPGAIIKTLNVSSLAAGTYLLHVQAENANVTRRFVVEK